MESLPEELIGQIFSYLNDPITASQVCSYFKLVATTQIRSIEIKLSSEKSDRIRFVEDALQEFKALKRLKLEICFDVNNTEKSKFCRMFSDKISNLVLRDMTFLNPFIDYDGISFCNLTSLTFENSDLTSCSEGISYFILNCCPKLKSLTISGCSGLDIDSLNFIGQNLNKTQIEIFNLLPTYSYFDVSPPPENNPWTIEKLTALSIRSKLVVMKRHFVKNLIGQRNKNLKILELIAELELGEHLPTHIIQNYPNLEKLSIGKGCSTVFNEDFVTLCNFYKKMKSFEFHFSQAESEVNFRSLEKNQAITDLTIGLTKNITKDNITIIAQCLPNVTRLSIILYFLSTSNQEFLTLITKIFPKVEHLEFSKVGMSENMKFTAIKDEIDSPNLRHFDDIQNLTN